MAVDLTALVGQLTLINNQAGRSMKIIESVIEPPAMRLTIDGASSVDIVVADHDRELINHPTADERTWANVAGLHFELVGLAKSGDRLTLKFEDAIIAALRRHTKPLTAKPNTTTRRGFAVRLAKEARVPYLIDPTHTERVHNVLQRSASGQRTNSWEVLGSEVAQPINWRRFSDGRQLVMGGDAWLTSGYRKPLSLRENTDGVQSIDFDLDVAKRASTATLSLDTRLQTLMPGTPVQLSQLGPADGLWLVSEVNQAVTSPRATVQLTRKTHVLKEPKATQRNRKSSRDRDRGDQDYVPTPAGDRGSKAAGNGARERMVLFALAQSGKPYSWGASGPGAYDCSGLVQAATRAAGKTLGKPSATQWATCRAAGKAIPVATALRIRGALLFRIGTGSYNHVAISLGNGSTVEARGTAYGCGVFGGAAGGGWTGAALWL